MVRRLLQEPLLHFVLLGAALFGAYAVLSPESGNDAGTIAVSTGQIENLAAQFARTRMRPPSAVELSQLIDSYVLEEVLYREGVALGLDRDDPIIKRRIGQKLAFLTEDAAVAEPTEVELQTFLQTHESFFTNEPRYTFRQIYFDPQRHEDSLQARLAQLRDELNSTDAEYDVTSLGDPTLLPSAFEQTAASDVENAFGADFMTALATLTPGTWQGPVSSTFGAHLVQINERSAARTPPLAEVREVVKREWMRERDAAATKTFYQTLRARYTVTVERREREPRAPGEGGDPSR